MRFEDTDIERNRPELIGPILESLRWLGLDWDEGPYFQSKRMSLYREHAEHLQRDGKAYPCYCTPAELEEKRKLAMAAKRKPKYDGHCRGLSSQERASLEAEGRKPSLRFKAPWEGITAVEDLIRGRVEFDNTELDDFIILRPDGRPTYNFAVVVDDITMKITHVIRADEHLNNTPKQVLLYQAFGAELPRFAHVPMVLAKDRAKLSKRHGATAVLEFKERGILPEALLNHLARLGWAHGDQEIFSIGELIEKFSLEAVHPAAAIFDEEKLLWLNWHYMKNADPKRLGELLREFLVKRDILSAEEAGAIKMDLLIEAADFLKERSHTLVELAERTRFIFSDEFEYDPKGIEKFFIPEKVTLLQGLVVELAHLNEFTAARIEEATRSYLEREGRKLSEIAQTCRVALTGRTEGPGLFETMEILGKDRVIVRLRRAIELMS